MNLTSEQEKGQEILNSIIAKSWEDESFKQELIASPIDTIKKFTGKESLSEDKKVFVVDQSNPDYIYINIPAKPNLDDVELTEDQLEAVSGGFQDPISWGFNQGVRLARWLLS